MFLYAASMPYDGMIHCPGVRFAAYPATPSEAAALGLTFCRCVVRLLCRVIRGKTWESTGGEGLAGPKTEAGTASPGKPMSSGSQRLGGVHGTTGSTPSVLVSGLMPVQGPLCRDDSPASPRAIYLAWQHMGGRTGRGR